MTFRLFIVIGIIHVLGDVAFSQSSAPKVRIITQQLKDQIELIGPLGVPVGKLVKVEGVSETLDDKLSSKILTVDIVNGKKLEKPVVVEYVVYNWANITKLEDGKRLLLNVYQEIGMRGIPDGVMEETTAVSTGWRQVIYTWVFVNQTSPKKLRFQNTYYDSLIGGHPFDAVK